MRFRDSLIILLLATVTLSGAGACRAPGEPPRQVILLLLDASRADRFSCYGYPRATTPEMDRLAGRGVVFHQHYAQGTGTRVSVPALLYSRYYSVPIFPEDPQVPYSSPRDLFRRPDDQQISFVKAFEAAGFTTAAISAHLWTGADTPFAAEFQQMHDLTTRVTSRRYPYPRARTVVDRAVEWIDEHRDEDFFLYLHLMDTHYPHYFEDDARAFFGAETYDARRFRDSGGPIVPSPRLSAGDLRYIDALYDGSLRYADREIGRLVDFLDQEDLLENAVLAVTSDHGEHLLDGEGGRPRPNVTVFSHGGPWLEPVARIPLILFHPDKLAPGHFRDFSEGVDVGPTLLSLAGVATPRGKSFDGVDLTATIAGQVPPKQQALMSRSIRTAKHKGLFANHDAKLLSEEAPAVSELRGRLYDLDADPGETTNLFAGESDVVADLARRFRATLKAPYDRAQAAITHDQPKAAFAIAARHMATDLKLPAIRGKNVPLGWSRFPGAPHSALVARNATEPLAIHFRVPDGHYRVSLGLAGQATVTVGDAESVLTGQDSGADFGEVEVTGEMFRATITPPPDGLLKVSFVGFVPPGGGHATLIDDERTRQLKALGYIQ